MALRRQTRINQINLENSSWFDLEVKQCKNSKTQFETAKKKQEDIEDWNFVPPMGHASDVVKYRSEDNEEIVSVLSIGGQDWQDPTRTGQISADLFVKELLVSQDEVAGLGPFKQIKAIKAISSKQTLSMAGGAGSLIRPMKNSSLTVIKSDVDGNFAAILAFGEFIEAGGLSNTTSNLFYKIAGNVKESEIEEVTLFAIERPENNPLYGKPLPEGPMLSGHKPTSRRGQSDCKLGDLSLVLYTGGVHHSNQLLRKVRIQDPFLILNSETMNIHKLRFDGEFSRAHHCSEFLPVLNKVVVSGGMEVPSEPGRKVSEWYRIDEFLIFQINSDYEVIQLVNIVKADIDIPTGFNMQGVASASLGEEVLFAGGFIQPEAAPKFGQSPKVSSAFFSVNFKSEKANMLDLSGGAKSAQATLHFLDPQAVLLVGGSIEALKIFTNKPMTEDKPCIYGEKCKVFNKIVNSEVEKLEISCENHPDNFSHVLCDTELKMSIRSIKQNLKAGRPVSYCCPLCKGAIADKRKKK